MRLGQRRTTSMHRNEISEGVRSEHRKKKRKQMLVLLGLTSRVCITEAFLFYGTEVQWTKMVVVVIIIYKMSLANQRSDALKPC